MAQDDNHKVLREFGWTEYEPESFSNPKIADVTVIGVKAGGFEIVRGSGVSAELLGTSRYHQPLRRFLRTY
jgi:hypothetical protein